MVKQERAIRQGVRLQVVLKYFGQLSLVLVILTLAPLGVSLIWGDFPGAIRYAFIVIWVGGLGGVLVRLPKPAHVQMNEAMVLVVLIFLFSSLVMTYPMMATGLNFGDAWFDEMIWVKSAVDFSISKEVTLKPTADLTPFFLFFFSFLLFTGLLRCGSPVVTPGYFF